MIIFPSIFPCTSMVYRPRAMNDMGPASFSGMRQVAATDAGYMVGRASYVLDTPELILEWRANVAEAEGSLNPVIIHLYEDFRTPYITGSGIGGITHSDGSTHSDGGGYSQSEINIELAASLALRATSATFTIVQAGAISRGMFFSLTGALGKPRAYMITRVTTEDDTASVQFLPPIREAIDVNLFPDVEMATPRATVRLANADTGEAEILPGEEARPTLEFYEDFDGL